uniref:Uncharacterized protein F3.2 n=1 Tax=Haloquadratum walsbyi TaxID=293091 RepID=A0A445MQG8_9EURY|nr:uncharacterized protein F3.2 [Haloquadratum walsbyi]
MCLRAQHQNTYRSFARAKILHTISADCCLVRSSN